MFTIRWKVEFEIYDKVRYLAKETSKQCVEGVAWFLLATYSKIQEKRDKLRMKLLNKKEPALGDLEKF